MTRRIRDSWHIVISYAFLCEADESEFGDDATVTQLGVTDRQNCIVPIHSWFCNTCLPIESKTPFFIDSKVEQ